MPIEDTVLSLNPDTQTLVGLEGALRGIGFQVISVSTPIQARFEIEMGRCGVFLVSYVMSSVICRDLIGLFRSSCPAGLVVFRVENEDDTLLDADLVVGSRDKPQSVAMKIASIVAKAS